jgi:hypothetical protein
MKLTSLGSAVGMALVGIMMGGIDRASAATIALYDGATFSGTPNLAPGSYLTFNSFDPFDLAAPPGTQTAGGGKTTLNTSSPESLYGGYSNYTLLNTLANAAFPVLDSNAGYTLSFRIKIDSQTNTGVNGSNRAGFSVTLLDSTSKGIELGFRNNDIFAQNSNFNAIDPAEQKISFGATLAEFSTYELKVLGNSYTLSNAGNDLFSGLLRNYAISSNPLTAVYGNPNFLFLGDNTTSAGARVDIQNITLTTNSTSTAVPEPSEAIGTLVAVGLGALLKRQLNRADLPKKSTDRIDRVEP